MNKPPDTPPEADALAAEGFGKVTVDVRIELAFLKVPARIWSKARTDDTFMLGLSAPLAGEPMRVVLRVGDVIVAHGDLCNVNGRVGVKVYEAPPEREPSGPRRPLGGPPRALPAVFMSYTIAAFPWSTRPRITDEEVRVLSLARRQTMPYLRSLDALQEALRAEFARPVSLRVVEVSVAPALPSPASYLCTPLALAPEGNTNLVVYLPKAMAIRLATSTPDGTVGGDPNERSGLSSEVERSVLVALVRAANRMGERTADRPRRHRARARDPRRAFASRDGRRAPWPLATAARAAVTRRARYPR
jgi:hypothetical protein